MKQLNITWIWFWFNIEFIVGKLSSIHHLHQLHTNDILVAFTVGCLVSFRALYTERSGSSKQAKLRERQQQAAMYAMPRPRGLLKVQALQDTLLTTFQDWEDTTRVDDDPLLLGRSTGVRTTDVERGEIWTGPSNSAHGGADSVQTLEAKEPSTQSRAF